jgi:hypothetical protein
MHPDLRGYPFHIGATNSTDFDFTLGRVHSKSRSHMISTGVVSLVPPLIRGVRNLRASWRWAVRRALPGRRGVAAASRFRLRSARPIRGGSEGSVGRESRAP